MGFNNENASSFEQMANEMDAQETVAETTETVAEETTEEVAEETEKAE